MLYPVDRSDPFSASSAVFIEWPESFSAKANETLRYFDDSAFLFRYKGRLVITDESLYLTEAGDGSMGSPLGFPRAVLDTMDQVEGWLEAVHSDLEADGYDFERMEFEWEREEA